MQNMEFKVRGITFENEEGKDIQKLIKKELKELEEQDIIGEKWEGYTNSEIKEMDLDVQEYSDITFYVKLKEDIFEGKKCVKVYIEKNNEEYIHVGYIPKKQLKEYEEKKENAININGIAELTGGRYKKCVWVEEDYEEKATVETVDLDYGLLVKLYFYYENENNLNKIQCKICEKQILNDIHDGVCEECHQEVLRRLEMKCNNSYDKIKREVENQQNIENIAKTIFWILFIGIAVFIFVKIFSFVDWLFS